MSRSAARQDSHYLTFPFELALPIAGGLPSVLLREATFGRANLHVLTTDAQSQEFRGLHLHAAEPEVGKPGPKFKHWFGTGAWTMLHPRAHTTGAVDAEVIAEMYAASDLPLNVGTIDHMIEFCRRHDPGLAIDDEFNVRFDGLFREIPKGATVNFQDYFFSRSIGKHADALRERGCFQTYHHHTTLPDSLHRSEWGRQLLADIAKVDEVYVHVDQYRTNLEQQWERMLGEGVISRVPEIRTFRLGIDQQFITDAMKAIDPESPALTIPGFQDLGDVQREVLLEAFASMGKVPHRFLCADRADPGKGMVTVAQAIRFYLRKQLAEGMDMDDLRKNFRFFFLAHLIDKPLKDNTNVADVYGEIVRRHLKELQEEFSGVVWVAPGLQGPARVAVPWVMRGCSVITGGAQDGLNLAVMECAKVNADLDTAVIAGDGTGFAMWLRAGGHEKMGAYLPKAGRVTDFVSSMEDIVRRQQTEPGSLRLDKERLVRLIDGRTDSVVVGR